MRTPRLHHVRYADGDHIGLWWEYVIQRPGAWQLSDYRRAAYLLGRLAARRREGAVVNQALPSVARDPHPACSSLRYFTEFRVLRGALPALHNGQVWSHPQIAAAIRQASDPALPGDMLALGARLPQILDMLDQLPQTHAHGDACPQNLLLPHDEPGAVVVIDWGFGSLLPVGFDLGQLLVGLAHAGQADPAQLHDIDAAIFPAYLDGLAAEGYEIAPGPVRAGYIGALAARSALSSLPVELLGNGAASASTEALILGRLQLTRLLVDLAAEVGCKAPIRCIMVSAVTGHHLASGC